MRRAGLLHAELLEVIAGLGHGQILVIADAGLPIARQVRRIDLAIRPGLPDLLSVLEVVLEEGVFEAATIATELPLSGTHVAGAIIGRLEQLLVEQVPHAELKRLAAESVAVVRTGEYTPYANVALRAGVPF